MRNISLKLLPFILFSLAFNLQSWSQKIIWQKAIGGSGYDNGMRMVPTDHDCYLMAGTTSSTDGLGEKNHGVGTFDIVVTKVTKSGSIVWKTIIGGSGTEEFGDLYPTKDGGCILIGTTDSRDGSITYNHGKMDILVAKLDKLGNISWLKCYGGTGNDKGFAAIQLSDGNYMLGGESGSRDGDMEWSMGGLDTWVAIINPKGEILKEKSFGGKKNERAIKVLEMKDNRFLIVSSTTSEAGTVKNLIGAKDAWLMCLSKTFDIVWQRTYGGTDFDEPHAIIRTADGDLLVAGTTFSEDEDLMMAKNQGLGDAWAFRISEHGELKWSKLYGGAKSDGINGLAQCPDGGFVLVGTSNSKKGDHQPNNGLYDGFVVRTDGDGNVIWQSQFGGEDFEYLYEVEPQEDGTYLALGFAESAKGDLAPTGKMSGNDFWFFRFTDPEKEATVPEMKTPGYLTGIVRSAGTKAPLAAKVTVSDNANLKSQESINCNSKTGLYEMDLAEGKEYSVMYTAEGFMFWGTNLDMSVLDSTPEIRIDVTLEPIVAGSKVILKYIFFDTGKWDLKDESKPELERLLKFMNANQNVKIEISGHTDNTGNVESKKELSLRRATKVRDWLLQAGVPGDNMEVAGYGMEQMICSEDGEECQSQNRRVEVKVIEVR